MTSPSSTKDRTTRRLAWAREHLGGGSEQSTPQLRANLLRAIAGEDFLPPPSWIEAYELLRNHEAGQPVAEDPLGCVVAMEEGLHARVEEFASRFFDFLPEEREKRWVQLYAECEGSVAMMARLEALATGLNAEPNKVDDANPRVRQLALYLGDLFVLRPIPRAQLLVKLLHDAALWEKAAQRLNKKNPEIAQLDGYLINEVGTASENEVRVRRIQSDVEIARKHDASTDRSSSDSAFVIVILMLVFGFAIVVFDSCNRSPPAEKYSNTGLSDEQIHHLFEMSDEELETKGGRTWLILLGLEEKRRQWRQERGLPVAPHGGGGYAPIPGPKSRQR